MARIAYYANDSYARRTDTGVEYFLAQVTEDEAGYSIATTGPDVTQLQELAEKRNAANGLSEIDKADILASSMRAGRV